MHTDGKNMSTQETLPDSEGFLILCSMAGPPSSGWLVSGFQNARAEGECGAATSVRGGSRWGPDGREAMRYDRGSAR